MAKGATGGDTTMKRRPTSKDIEEDYDEEKREEDVEEQGRGKRTVRMDKIFVK